MKGLNIGNNDNFIERFIQEGGDLGLIARKNGTEIMVQDIKKDAPSFIEPAESEELMEFFYILEGELLIITEEEERKLSKNEYFYVCDLEETVNCKAITDVKLLYITTKPVFQYLSSTVRDLKEMADKSQKKDMYTHNHVERVQSYALAIANKLNLPADVVERIAYAALFHDIGKIYVPDEILKKPTSLTREEFDEIKKHVQYGAELVEKTYFKDLSKVVMEHHEKYDGSGYPKGLKDGNISIEARIISIADSYDAMTSDRAYRKAMTEGEALAEIRKYSGTHYDPKLVEIFAEVLYKKEGIK